MKVKLALIERVESIIREAVRPLENIDGIKIVQVDGLSVGGGSTGGERTGAGGGGLSDQLVSSALRFRAQAPLVNSLLKEVGLNSGSVQGLLPKPEAGA